jgi:hypothetical protein
MSPLRDEEFLRILASAPWERMPKTAKAGGQK